MKTAKSMDDREISQTEAEKILSIKQAAAILEKSPGWVYQYYSSLGGVKVGGSIFIKRSTLLKALDNNQAKENKPAKVAPIKKKNKTILDRDAIIAAMLYSDAIKAEAKDQRHPSPKILELVRKREDEPTVEL
jgi:hypothetical protein